MRISIGREFGRVLEGVLAFLAHFQFFGESFRESSSHFGRVLGAFFTYRLYCVSLVSVSRAIRR